MLRNPADVRRPDSLHHQHTAVSVADSPLPQPPSLQRHQFGRVALQQTQQQYQTLSFGRHPLESLAPQSHVGGPSRQLPPAPAAALHTHFDSGSVFDEAAEWQRRKSLTASSSGYSGAFAASATSRDASRSSFGRGPPAAVPPPTALAVATPTASTPLGSMGSGAGGHADAFSRVHRVHQRPPALGATTQPRAAPEVHPAVETTVMGFKSPSHVSPWVRATLLPPIAATTTTFEQPVNDPFNHDEAEAHVKAKKNETRRRQPFEDLRSNDGSSGDDGGADEEVTEFVVENPWGTTSTATTHNNTVSPSALAPTPSSELNDLGRTVPPMTAEERRRAKKERMALLQRALSELEEVPSQPGLSSNATPTDPYPYPYQNGNNSNNNNARRGNQHFSTSPSPRQHDSEMRALDEEYRGVEMLQPNLRHSDMAAVTAAATGAPGGGGLRRVLTRSTMRAMEFDPRGDSGETAASDEPAEHLIRQHASFGQHTAAAAAGKRGGGGGLRDALASFRFGGGASTTSLPDLEARAARGDAAGSAAFSSGAAVASFTPLDQLSTSSPNVFGNSRRGSHASGPADATQVIKVTTMKVRETVTESENIKAIVLAHNLEVLYFSREPKSRAVIRRERLTKVLAVLGIFVLVAVGVVLALYFTNVF